MSVVSLLKHSMLSQGEESIIDKPAPLFVNYTETIWQKTLICPEEDVKQVECSISLSKNISMKNAKKPLRES